MGVVGWQGWANTSQFFLAGVAVMVAVYQAAVGRWRGQRASAWALATTSALAAGVLITNAVVVASLHSSDLNAWVVARDLLISGLLLSAVPLISALVHPQPSWLWHALVGSAVTTRLVLFIGTHTIYQYSRLDGFPRYGSLLVPTTVVMLAIVTGFLVRMAVLAAVELERAICLVGIMSTVLLALVSVLIPEGVGAELLTGYLSLPSLFALVIVVWLRQTDAERLTLRFARRQQRLAGLSSLAVNAPTRDVVKAAVAIVESELPAAMAAVAGTLSGHGEDQGWGDDGAEGPGGHGGTDHHDHPGCHFGGGGSGVPGANAFDGDPVSGLDDEDHQFATAVRNVVTASARRSQAVSELERRASVDELTGLANRTGLRHLIADALDRHLQVAVAVCNLSRFATVNELYGPAQADEVLRMVGRRLSEELPACEVGRMTGVDFAIVWEGRDGSHDLDALAGSIHRALRAPLCLGSSEIRVSARVGVATRHGAGADADLLLRDAVTALREAALDEQSTGSFRPELRHAATRRADIHSRLSGAVARGEIVVHYQPVIELASQSIDAFEALARWHYGSEFLPAAEWIPVAEVSGTIGEIGEHVLMTAAAQAGRWHDQGYRVNLSVNASPRQLGDRTFADIVDRATQLLPARHLMLEVTENLALNERARATIDQVRRMGVHLALDDFGTGYSALASIAQVPIDTVKIDKSIIDRIDQPDGRALVSATVAIARTLGLSVVAEGVEHRAQHQALRELGCSHAQGFLYSRPVDADAAARLLADGLVPYPAEPS